MSDEDREALFQEIQMKQDAVKAEIKEKEEEIRTRQRELLDEIRQRVDAAGVAKRDFFAANAEAVKSLKLASAEVLQNSSSSQRTKQAQDSVDAIKDAYELLPRTTQYDMDVILDSELYQASNRQSDIKV